MRFRDALFEAVKDEVIGWTAAKAIGEVVAVDSVLTKKNHANVKVRARQIPWIPFLISSSSYTLRNMLVKCFPGL